MIRKFFFIIILTLVTTVIHSQINWLTIEEAQNAIKLSPRPVLVFLYADWCDHCKEMRETTLEDPDISKYINALFYPVLFNAEHPDTIQFKNRNYINPNPGQHKSWHWLALTLAAYDKSIGFPTIVFLNEKLDKILKPTRGFKSVEKLEKYIYFVGDAQYKKSTFEEYEKSFSKKSPAETVDENKIDECNEDV